MAAAPSAGSVAGMATAPATAGFSGAAGLPANAAGASPALGGTGAGGSLGGMSWPLSTDQTLKLGGLMSSQMGNMSKPPTQPTPSVVPYSAAPQQRRGREFPPLLQFRPIRLG